MSDIKTIVVPWDDGTDDEIRFTYSGGITIEIESDNNQTKFERRKLIVFKTDFPNHAQTAHITENEVYFSLVQTVDNVMIILSQASNQTKGDLIIEVDPTWVQIPALGNLPDGDNVRVLTNRLPHNSFKLS